MNAEQAAGQDRTAVNRTSDREVVVSRAFDTPARIVFEAWTKPELFQRWWTPKSYGLTMISCEMDVRTGGSYRLAIRPPGADQPMSFFGRYIEVTAPARLVWTNDEGGEGGATTTVDFEVRGDQTLVVMRDLYPSKEALDEAIASGSTGGISETLQQLEELLASTSPRNGRP